MTLEQEMLIRENRIRKKGREEREQQIRALYLAMKRDGRRDEYDDLMESGDSARIDKLLEEYGLAE